MPRILIGAVMSAAAALLWPVGAAAHLVPLPSPMIRIVHADCPGVSGASCYDHWHRTAYVGMRDRFFLYHEIGHGFDDVELSEGERNRFRTLIGSPGLAWWIKDHDGGDQSRSSAGEQFADAYANCMLGNGTRRFADGTSQTSWSASTPYFPSMAVHRRVCGFIRRAWNRP